MSKLLEGKTAIVLGVWNKWSIAYAIAQAFVREGATLLLTYQNERAKPAVEELGRELGAASFFPCEVQQQEDIDRLAESLKAEGRKLDVVVHSLAAAKHEEINQPFLNTSRDKGAFAADDGGRFDHDADVSRLDARGDQLQRDGRGQGRS
jgi:enoyl-[acyl-carrier protein] reductase I